jgi:hypothetical protein
MTKIALAIVSAVALSLCAPAAARTTLECDGAAFWNPVAWSHPTPGMLAQITPPTSAQPMPAATPAVVTQAPAIIDTGTIGGQVLTWVMATFGTTIGAALTALIWKLLQKAGIQANDALRARLQEIVLNGLNAGTKIAAEQLAGRGKIEIKQAAVASTVRYVQAHGADTIKALGLDPMGAQAVEAIKARIETAITDPAIPTPKILDPTPAAPIVEAAKPSA